MIYQSNSSPWDLRPPSIKRVIAVWLVQDQGLSQSRAASLVGVARSAVSRWLFPERAKRATQAQLAWHKSPKGQASRKARLARKAKLAKAIARAKTPRGLVPYQGAPR